MLRRNTETMASKPMPRPAGRGPFNHSRRVPRGRGPAPAGTNGRPGSISSKRIAEGKESANSDAVCGTRGLSLCKDKSEARQCSGVAIGTLFAPLGGNCVGLL
jgi:hypothetical protein